MATTIRIDDIIGGGWLAAKDVVREIESTSDDVIDLAVNSPGGYIDEGTAIIAALRRHPARVEARVMGLAASMAATVVVAGADHIAISHGARMMIHMPWTISTGSAADLRRDADMLDTLADDHADWFAARLGLSRAEALAVMEDETWFTPASAVDAGLADEISDGAEAVATPRRWAKMLASYRRTPSPLLPDPNKYAMLDEESKLTYRDESLFEVVEGAREALRRI